MRTMMVARVVPVVVALLTASVGVAVAHETGAIHLVSKELAPGGELAFAGEKLPKGASLKVELRGALNKYSIGTITTDKAGKVQARLTVPANVPNGNYTVAVLASDGDVAARAPLVVTSAPAKATQNTPGMSHDMAGMAGMKGMEGMSGPHATAEMMPLKQQRAPGQWAVIAAVVGACFVAGAALLRKATRLAAGEQGATLDAASVSSVRPA